MTRPDRNLPRDPEPPQPDPYAPIIVDGIRYDPRTVRDDFERECG